MPDIENNMPKSMSVRNWWKVLSRTYQEVNDDRVMLIAAGVTYFLLLALFPAVTAFVSIYGLFVDPVTVGKQIDLLANIVPAGGLQIIHDQLTRITQQGAPTLGLALLISLGVALWSASSGVKAIFDVMNVAYDEKERRNFLVLNGVALAFTIAGVVAAAVMLSAVVAIPAILSVVGLGKGVEWLVQIAGYIVMLLVLLTALAALYRFGPSRHQAKWQWITPGAVTALLIIGVASGLFSWYAASLGHFDQTYGSLGALLGFLFWMWVCLIAVIVGAELNSELEHQTASSPILRVAGAAGDAGPDRSRKDPDTGPKDNPDDRSAEWLSGYNAAIKARRTRRPRMPGIVVIPALAAAALLEFRNRRRDA